MGIISGSLVRGASFEESCIIGKRSKLSPMVGLHGLSDKLEQCGLLLKTVSGLQGLVSTKVYSSCEGFCIEFHLEFQLVVGG